jgi:protein CpxP
MRTPILWSLVLLLTPLYPALGQQRDTSAVRSDSLRQRIQERFASRVQQELGLSNDQTAKLRATSQQYSARYRELQTRHRDLREALGDQLRPGVAAKQDSVAKLTDGLIELRLSAAQLTRDEMRDVGKYLTPVQRARYFMMRERFQHRVRELREHRGMRGRNDGSRDWRGRQRGSREPHE